MERYVVLNEARLAIETHEQRNNIVQLLLAGGRFPRVAVIWSDVDGVAHAVDVIIVSESPSDMVIPACSPPSSTSCV